MIFIDHFKWLSIFNGCYAIGEKFRLLEKLNAGVKVRLIINKGHSENVKNFTRPLFDQGAVVRYVTLINHHKFAIVDGAVLLNSSGNFSGSYRARNYDENLVVCDYESCGQHVDAFLEEFNSMIQVSNQVFAESGVAPFPIRREPVNATRQKVALFTSGNFYPRLSRGKVRLNRFPTQVNGHGKLDQVLIDAIDNAKEEILVATGHFRSYPLYLALKRAVDRNVVVKMILDGQEYISKSKQKKESAKVKRCLASGKSNFACYKTGIHFARLAMLSGIDVLIKYYMIRWHFPRAKQMHHKYMIIDKKTLYSGSYNWSFNAEFKTFENVAVFKKQSVIDSFIKNFVEARNYGGGPSGVKKLKALYKAASNSIALSFNPISATIKEIDSIKRLARSRCRNLYVNPVELATCRF
ncbi:MAG: phosphatidylserine/phosphatidylglycerophosphate/cardiolipin synthase family protein [Bacteriovoracaceae bacterium]|nr:phosphatidylserine/phosphatidylglycerophosphate/cardiolipin synthase family protein [Bacteriovoracaceae bacterium]